MNRLFLLLFLYTQAWSMLVKDPADGEWSAPIQSPPIVRSQLDEDEDAAFDRQTEAERAELPRRVAEVLAAIEAKKNHVPQEKKVQVQTANTLSFERVPVRPTASATVAQS